MQIWLHVLHDARESVCHPLDLVPLGYFIGKDVVGSRQWTLALCDDLQHLFSEIEVLQECELV